MTGRHKRWGGAALLALTAIATCVSAEIGTTPNNLYISGENSNSNTTCWHTWGGMIYVSETHIPAFQTDYDVEEVDQWFFGVQNPPPPFQESYDDATVWHRQVVVYDPPGTNSVVWESCDQEDMETYVIPSSGFWHRVVADTAPGEFSGNSMKDVIFKVQSKGFQGGNPQGGMQYTLLKNAD